MSIDYVIQHAAPTLAGIKTGNLFPCTFASTQDMVRDLREINRVLVPRGLRLLPLRRKDDRALLYLFRPADLSRDLAGQEARRLLREAGYGDDLTHFVCLRELTRRLREGEEFPRDRPLPGLSPGGRGRVYDPPGQELQMRGLLEGLRR